MSPITTTTAQTKNIFNIIIPQVSAEFEAPASNSQWYKTTTPFVLPDDIGNSSYSLVITATDETGETGSLSFSVTVSGSQN